MENPERASYFPNTSNASCIMTTNLSTNSNKNRSDVEVDATLLRRVLRLVHCLQIERGASFYAPSSSDVLSNGVLMNDDGSAGTPSSSSAPEHLRTIRLQAIRHDTDRALTAMLEWLSVNPTTCSAVLDPKTIRRTLETIRNMTSILSSSLSGTATSLTNPKKAQSSSSSTKASTTDHHRILLCFNTLVSSILHDYIIDAHAEFQRKLQTEPLIDSVSLPSFANDSADDVRELSNSDKINHRKMLSPQQRRPATHRSLLNRKSESSIPRTLVDRKSEASLEHVGGIVRVQSNGDMTQFVCGSDFCGSSCGNNKNRKGHKRALSADALNVLISPELLQVSKGDAFAQQEGSCKCESNSSDTLDNGNQSKGRAATTACDSKIKQKKQVGFQQEIDNLNDDDPAANEQRKLLRLFSLLDISVRLKECTGVERATLSSMLAIISNHFAVDFSLFLNDLVMQVEVARRLVDNLKESPPGVLYKLVQEVVKLSPEMLDLQDDILTIAFDYEDQNTLRDLKEKYDMATLWDLLTVYIDKLHSLELLIVEEIECCFSVVTTKELKVVTELSRPREIRRDATETLIKGESVDSISENASARKSNSVSGAETTQMIDLLKSILGLSLPLSAADNNKSDEPCATSVMGPLRAVEEIIRGIEAMPAEEVKERLIALLKTQTTKAQDNLRGPPSEAKNDTEPPVTRVDDLLKELSLNAPASKEWEIDLYQIRFVKRIAQGTAGTTYLADWSGLNVAVKVASITEMGLDGWRTEVQSLQKLHHPNIIRLLGSVYHPNPLTFCLVLEYCNAGNLSEALDRPTPSNFFFRTSNCIAQGMSYLHGRGIIHRDIKPGNVLLDGDVRSGNFIAKVSDFGVATESKGKDNLTSETGTYRWMSPEVIRHEAYSQTADVYSFAVLLWQLVTHENPFENVSQIEAAAGVAYDSARPPFPANTPSAIQQLIEMCWSDDPSARLPFDEISTRLKKMEQSDNILTAEEKKWLEAPIGNNVYAMNYEPSKPIVDRKKNKNERRRFRFFSRATGRWFLAAPCHFVTWLCGIVGAPAFA